MCTTMLFLTFIICSSCVYTYNGSEFYTTEECDYYSDNIYPLADPHLILPNINLTTAYFEYNKGEKTMNSQHIQLDFSINLTNKCNVTRCNILSIFHDNRDILSISVMGYLDAIELSLSTVEQYEFISRIPNASQLLTTNGDSHNISFHTQSLITTLAIDDVYALTTHFSVDNVYRKGWSKDLNQYNGNSLCDVYIDSAPNSGVKGFISDICIKNSHRTLWTEQISVESKIKCGDSLSGMGYGTYYYHFNFSHVDSAVLITTVTAYTVVDYIALYNMDLELLYEIGPYYNLNSLQLFINLLSRGEYILSFDIFQYWWDVQILCGNNATNWKRFESVLYQWANTDTYENDFFQESQKLCEKNFGTSLATIVTEHDMKSALAYIEYYWGPYETRSIHLGAYTDIIHNYQWSWLDGTKTISSKLMNNSISWDGDINNLSESFYSRLNWVGVSHSDSAYIQTYTASYGFNMSKQALSLCNKPNTKYQPTHCKNAENCWHQISCCENTTVINDVVFSYDQLVGMGLWKPPVAFWNHTLYIVGFNQIHYTHFDLFQDVFAWNHIQYKRINYTYWTISPQYAQFKSSLYLYFTNKHYENPQDKLIHVDLNNANITYHFPPEHRFDFVHISYSLDLYRGICLAANAMSVYIIQGSSIMVYDVLNEAWRITPMYYVDDSGLQRNFMSDDQVSVLSCTMDMQYRMLYISTYDGIIFQYDTIFRKLNIIQQRSSICLKYDTKTMMVGMNGKMYIHGCYYVSWKTLIYNIESKKYETNTVDISEPTPLNMPYYRDSAFAYFDDNIWIMVTVNDGILPVNYAENKTKTISMYYAATAVVSINFTQTILMHHVWPSDGLEIKYYLNDFNDPTLSIYSISFSTLAKTINASVTLNTSKDDCTCNQYNCYDCNYHFDIAHYLSPKNNDIKELTFTPKHNYSFEILFLPKEFNIQLQRCNLSIHMVKATTSNLDPSIHFNFSLSNNCYSRKGKRYIVDIKAKKLNVSSQLQIRVTNESNHWCAICADDCSPCQYDSFAICHGVYNLEEGEYDILMKSDSIDLALLTSGSSKIYYSVKNIGLNKEFLYFVLLALSIFILLIVASIHFVLRKQYMDAYIVDKCIVLIIGCSQFDTKTAFLPGVNRNIVDLITLWKDNYNYDVFICNNISLYATKQQIIEFIDESMKKITSLQYKCVIVHVISHGIEDGFVTSDHKQISLQFILHELNCLEQPLIKIIFNHACRGTANYSDAISTPTNELEETNQEYSVTTRAFFCTNAKSDFSLSVDSNWIIISGNVKGRTMSDIGNFTESICVSFKKNLDRQCCNGGFFAWKHDLKALIVEIRKHLEQKSNSSEICNDNGTLHHNKIRFEKAAVLNSTERTTKIDIELHAIPTNHADMNTDEDYVLMTD
eukprot:12595_1